MKLEGDLEENYTNAKQELEEMERLIRKGAGRFSTTGFKKKRSIREFIREDYCKMVEKLKYIYEGDIFQVVLSNPLTAKAKGSLLIPTGCFEPRNPSPYVLLFK